MVFVWDFLVWLVIFTCQPPYFRMMRYPCTPCPWHAWASLVLSTHMVWSCPSVHFIPVHQLLSIPVQQFIQRQQIAQITKETRRKRRADAFKTITAFYPNDIWQIDLMIYSLWISWAVWRSENLKFRLFVSKRSEIQTFSDFFETKSLNFKFQTVKLPPLIHSEQTGSPQI